jgi:hypothetical protein
MSNEFRVGDTVSVTFVVEDVSPAGLVGGYTSEDGLGMYKAFSTEAVTLVKRAEPKYTVELTQAELNAIKDCVGLTPTALMAMSSATYDALYEKLTSL